jgi:hypothetical protein
MLAALLCGLGLPTPRAREPLFASTLSAVQRESRGKNGVAAAEVKEWCYVEWCYTHTDEYGARVALDEVECHKSYYLKEVKDMIEGVPVHIHDPMNDQGLSDMKCRPSSDEWANWCDENDQKTCGASYFLTEAGVPKRCAWVEGKCTTRGGGAVPPAAVPPLSPAAVPPAELRIPLVAGWNRISSNIQLDGDAPLLSGQDAALLDAVVELRGVDGTISTDLMRNALVDSQGYKLKMASGPHELVLSGPPVDVCTPIPLNAGVTWIPYLLQDEEADLDALRRTAGVWTPGDTIQDETSGTFTTWYDGWGWYGTLTTLRAGRMYVVTSDQEGTLTYALTHADLDECI